VNFQNPEWVTGVYFAAPRSDQTAIVAMNQLPLTSETLWMRLLGKGKVQQEAIAEVLAFNKDDICRESILQLLVSWKISRELTGSIAQAREPEESELMAKLSQAYLEWEQRTRQEGIEEGAARERSLILRQLTRRVGSLSTDLRSRVESLSLEQLESLGEALLDFSAIADLETWLQTYGN
jgi:Domain of unknown function (DUF4351)